MQTLVYTVGEFEVSKALCVQVCCRINYMFLYKHGNLYSMQEPAFRRKLLLLACRRLEQKCGHR